ncbi:alpha/beta hydrolase [Pigmentiphaga daeguensis]|uniref:Alpha/beta fold hydrolase n=1 Tax=Pigmentiphaga daeguensis TaxID=414049 RepID=A0ABN1CGH7_9BURK
MKTESPWVGLHVAVAGSKMFVRVQGNGPPVLLLHGGGPGTCGEGWTPFVAACSGQRQYLAPDHLGFGYSDVPDIDYGGNMLAQRVIELMDTLCLGRVALVGHSMGAAVAAAVAAARPESISHLVLIAPGGGTYGLAYRSPGIEQIARIVDIPSRDNMRALVRLMSNCPASHDRQVEQRMRLVARPGLMDVQRRLLQARSGVSAAERAELAGKLRALTQPVALVWGEEERFNPGGLGPLIREKLPPQTTYHVIPGAGHNVQYDEPERAAKVLDEVLGAS